MCVGLWWFIDFEVINLYDTDPHGDDWEFQTANGEFRLGQFETESINLLEHTTDIRIINQGSKFGAKNFNPYAVMPDGRTAGQWRGENISKSLNTPNPITGEKLSAEIGKRSSITKNKKTTMAEQMLRMLRLSLRSQKQRH